MEQQSINKPENQAPNIKPVSTILRFALFLLGFFGIIFLFWVFTSFFSFLGWFSPILTIFLLYLMVIKFIPKEKRRFVLSGMNFAVALSIILLGSCALMFANWGK